jgi:hypothetical protein
MALRETLVKKLAKKYAPDEMVDLRHGSNDMTVKTDGDGNAILLFIGRRMENGHIKGERYARRLVFDESGKTVKDHWELKGKST